MCADVVGREAELGAVAEFLDSLDGPSGALFFEGEPGIGKTTLWLAAVAQARRRGFRVLSCRPSEAEAQLSFASLADLLADVGDRVLASLPEPQRRAIDFVLLRAGSEDVATDPRAIGAALLSVLERCADDVPVLLTIDDPQWLDKSSAGAVEFAVRRASSRVGLLAALRADERGDVGLSLRLPDPDRLRRIRAGPLSLGGARRGRCASTLARRTRGCRGTPRTGGRARSRCPRAPYSVGPARFRRGRPAAGPDRSGGDSLRTWSRAYSG